MGRRGNPAGTAIRGEKTGTELWGREGLGPDQAKGMLAHDGRTYREKMSSRLLRPTHLRQRGINPKSPRTHLRRASRCSVPFARARPYCAFGTSGISGDTGRSTLSDRSEDRGSASSSCSLPELSCALSLRLSVGSRISACRHWVCMSHDTEVERLVESGNP